MVNNQFIRVSYMFSLFELEIDLYISEIFLTFHWIYFYLWICAINFNFKKLFPYNSQWNQVFLGVIESLDLSLILSLKVELYPLDIKPLMVKPNPVSALVLTRRHNLGHAFIDSNWWKCKQAYSLIPHREHFFSCEWINHWLCHLHRHWKLSLIPWRENQSCILPNPVGGLIQIWRHSRAHT